MLALSGTFISGSPIGTQAAGSTGSPGSAWAWGLNSTGQLGNGTTTSSSTPIAVTNGTSVTAIAGGGGHSLALTSSGQVLAWGFNYYGQLGNGTTTNSSTPVAVSLPAGTTVTAIAGGGDHSLALTSTGQVLAWGYNGGGELGNGTITNSSTPVAVSLPSGTTVTAIAGGSNHSLALTSTGQILAWGYNLYGQLGNGTTTSSSIPVAVSLASGTTVTAIAGGEYHNLALTSTGQVLAWGDNFSGELGNGTTTNSSIPVAVSLPSGTTVTAIAGGFSHSLALTSTGQVLAWGFNGYGELGNGTITNSSTPVAVSLPSATTITAIAGGLAHSLALTSANKVLAWGRNLEGQLGNGTTTNSSTPVVVSAIRAAVAISGGGYYSLAIQLPSVGSPGSAWAWGSNSYGQLGNGTTTDSSTPVAVSLPGGTTVTAIAGGIYHSLALTSSGQVLAWGYNLYGQLGNGTTTNSSTPVAVSLASGTTITAIAGGGGHSLALTSSGQVLAWGDNYYGELGNGTTTNSSTPVAVSLPSGTTVTAIAGGIYHSLALTSSGQVLAWGYNAYGQLGNGTTTNSSTPVAISLPSGTTVTAIAGGGDHSLALTSSGQVLAWGLNSSGQLGNGTTTNSSIPVQVSLPSGTTVTAIAGGGSHSLALTSNGQVLAWGYNNYGELGNGTSFNSFSTPVAVSLPSGTSVTAIAGGSLHSLALTSTGQVLAWGRNLEGELGNGTTTTTGCWCISYPVVVSAIRAAVAISGGGYHSLAIQLPSVAVFPAMANGAYGGYVTAATIQNTGSAPASIRIAYFDLNGTPVGAGDAIYNLPMAASWTVRQDNGNSFPSSGGNAAQAGSAVIYSSQPIASFVNEFAPGNVGDATSYSGIQVPSGVGATLYAPTIVNNAYGGYTTGIGLLNQGSSPTNVTITYRDGTGAVAKTQTVSGLAAHAYQALYSGDAVLALPSGFAGTATITSSAGQPLGAIVNETGPGGQFSSYDAVPSGSTLLNVPVALNNAYGGYYTGMAIQNTSAIAGTVSVTYYDASGTATAKSFSIAAFGSLGVYQGSATDGPAAGAYTAVIQSFAGLARLPLAAIVNEVAPPAGTAQQSTSYNTFSAGSRSLYLPLVENSGSDPWNTGEGIMNTGTSSTTVIVVYFDASTGAAIGTAQTQVLAPYAFWGLYQPTGGLPSGSRATAKVITVPTPFFGQIAVICNESGSSTFMSYNGQ
jgi:alpha-tubulin suppressor-like RCC1 family protein